MVAPWCPGGPCGVFCYIFSTYTPSHFWFIFLSRQVSRKIPRILPRVSFRSIGTIATSRHHQYIESERSIEVSERENKTWRGMNWFSPILILGALDDVLNLLLFPVGISFTVCWLSCIIIYHSFLIASTRPLSLKLALCSHPPQSSPTSYSHFLHTTIFSYPQGSLARSPPSRSPGIIPAVRVGPPDGSALCNQSDRILCI